MRTTVRSASFKSVVRKEPPPTHAAKATILPALLALVSGAFLPCRLARYDFQDCRPGMPDGISHAAEGQISPTGCLVAGSTAWACSEPASRGCMSQFMYSRSRSRLARGLSDGAFVMGIALFTAFQGWIFAQTSRPQASPMACGTFFYSAPSGFWANGFAPGFSVDFLAVSGPWYAKDTDGRVRTHWRRLFGVLLHTACCKWINDTGRAILHCRQNRARVVFVVIGLLALIGVGQALRRCRLDSGRRYPALCRAGTT